MFIFAAQKVNALSYRLVKLWIVTVLQKINFVGIRIAHKEWIKELKMPVEWKFQQFMPTLLTD